MSIEIRQMTIRSTVVRDDPLRRPESEPPLDAELIKEELRQELRQVLAELLREQRER